MLSTTVSSVCIAVKMFEPEQSTIWPLFGFSAIHFTDGRLVNMCLLKETPESDKFHMLMFPPSQADSIVTLSLENAKALIRRWW